MKTIALVVMATSLVATTAFATVYVSEGFEGSFPPAGWTVTATSNAGWDKGTGGGPDGAYAYGTVYCGEGQFGYTTLKTVEFTVPYGKTVHVRFDCNHGDIAHGGGYADFTLACVDPETVLLSKHFTGTKSWYTYTASAVNNLGTRFVASWYVYGSCSWRDGGYVLVLDRFYVSDTTVNPAVAPASLGRVKALYR